MRFTEAEILESIRSLEVITGHPRLALQLINLGRTPDASPEDYSRLIEKDLSLASRLLGLVNSAVYAPGNPILTVQRGVTTLGLKSVRELALSHCVASLHRAMALGHTNSHSLWKSSLCKAIASRKIAEALNLEDSDGAFSAGLLQDLGIALLSSLDHEAVIEAWSHSDRDQQQALFYEEHHFGLHHSEVGLRIAQRLDLPAEYLEVIDHHHSQAPLKKLAGFELAVGVSSLLPHDGKTWLDQDLQQLKSFFEERKLGWSDAEQFLVEVEQEFTRTEESLGNDSLEPPTLLEGLMYASQENARSSFSAVYQYTWLREDTNTLNDALDHAERAHSEAEQRADRDPLTQLFNRGGWDRRARMTLSQSSSLDGTVGVAFFDLDFFKELNDEFGHAAGDFFLKEVSSRMMESVRNDDLVCRWGGDEFVILFSGSNPTDCLEAARRVKSHVQRTPIRFDGKDMKVSATVGFVSISADAEEMNLGDLLQIADEQLYKAKATRRGTMSFTRVRE